MRNRLPELRAERGWSQARLAEALERFTSSTGVLGMVSIDEDFFVLIRRDSSGVRMVLSDVTAIAESDLAADVAALVRGLVRLFRDPTTVAFVRTRATADDPELRGSLHELASQDTAFVRQPFERAIARGELPPDTDVGLLVELLVSPLLARVVVWGGRRIGGDQSREITADSREPIRVAD